MLIMKIVNIVIGELCYKVCRFSWILVSGVGVEVVDMVVGSSVR